MLTSLAGRGQIALTYTLYSSINRIQDVIRCKVPLGEIAKQEQIRALSKRVSTIRAGIRRSKNLVWSWNKGIRRRVPVRNLPRTVPRAGLKMSEKLVLVVAAALIDGKGRVLLAKRPEGRALAGLWEFPGGKVDEGERPEQALIRELEEELGIKVSFEDLKPLTFASHSYDDFHLLMPLYECSKWGGDPQGKEGQEIAWVSANDLDKYDMPQADQPLIGPVQSAVHRLAQTIISEFA
eukprot:jgi/Botrbrau1/1120/Bobra.0162s0018.2